MKMEVSVEVDAPADVVWAIMSDVERWPEWTASVSTVRRLDDGAFRIGSRARVKQPKFPEMAWTVISLEPGRSFEWETLTTGARTAGTHTVEPAGSGSRVTLGIRQTGLMGKLLSPFTNGITRRYIEMEAAGLKRRSEQAQAATAA